MFTYLNKQEKDFWLPQLFDLLNDNMSVIAPSGYSYEKEKAKWLAAVSPALDKEPRQIIMCIIHGQPVGFIQYYIRQHLLMIEELQIKKDYQKSTLFFQFCRHMLSVIPQDLQTVEAYADKRNIHSVNLMKKMGMLALEDDASCPFLHMRGPAEKLHLIFGHQNRTYRKKACLSGASNKKKV